MAMIGLSGLIIVVPLIAKALFMAPPIVLCSWLHSLFYFRKLPLAKSLSKAMSRVMYRKMFKFCVFDSSILSIKFDCAKNKMLLYFYYRVSLDI